jgi:hypothetical protein
MGPVYKSMMREGPMNYTRPTQRPSSEFNRFLEGPDMKKAPECPNVEDLVRPLTASGCGEAFGLTALRSRIIGNKNLFKRALFRDLDKKISVRKFEPHKNWKPPRFDQPEALESTLGNFEIKSGESVFDLLSTEDVMTLIGAADMESKLSEIIASKDKTTNKPSGYSPREFQKIGDKSLADSVEALIGSFLISTGQTGALRFMRYMKLELSPGDEPDQRPDDSKWYDPPKTAVIGTDIAMRSVLTKLDIPQVNTT